MDFIVTTILMKALNMPSKRTLLTKVFSTQVTVKSDTQMHSI
eukprot:14969.XXX_234477_234602_1 [CDS] Oithona nana genome sequencing.